MKLQTRIAANRFIGSRNTHRLTGNVGYTRAAPWVVKNSNASLRNSRCLAFPESEASADSMEKSSLSSA